MEFDKSRVYTALNADELKIGSKVYVADSIACLEDCATENCNPVTLSEVRGSEHKDRFAVLNDGNVAFNLAYLVEEPEENKVEEKSDKYRNMVFDLLEEKEKAKVIIKELSDAYEYVTRHKEYADREVLARAEQFLKEVKEND